MSDQDIFDKDGNKVVADPVAAVAPVVPAVVTAVAAPPADVFAASLAVIKNTDGTPKYDSVPKALEALASSQLHIQTLEAEAATNATALVSLREQVAKNAVVEEVVARLAPQDEQVQETPQPTVVNEESVMAMVRNALSADRTANQATENVASVQAALIAKYADKAGEVLAAKAQELGTDLDGLKKLSSESPGVVLALFGEATPAPNNPVPSSMSIHPGLKAPEALQPPEKSLLMGASAKEQMAYMRQIQAEVYAKHGVEPET